MFYLTWFNNLIPVKLTYITLYMKKDRGNIVGLNANTYKVIRAMGFDL